MKKLVTLLVLLTAISAYSYDGVILYDGDGNKAEVNTSGALHVSSAISNNLSRF